MAPPLHGSLSTRLKIMIRIIVTFTGLNDLMAIKILLMRRICVTGSIRFNLSFLFKNLK
jgi:hypothetical protein